MDTVIAIQGISVFFLRPEIDWRSLLDVWRLILRSLVIVPRYLRSTPDISANPFLVVARDCNLDLLDVPH